MWRWMNTVYVYVYIHAHGHGSMSFGVGVLGQCLKHLRGCRSLFMLVFSLCFRGVIPR